MHRWSGWPGAFCLDCGIEDPMEFAAANIYIDAWTMEWQSFSIYAGMYPWLYFECPIKEKK